MLKVTEIMSIVPKKNRDDIYRYLFTEGVLCCEKNRLNNWSGELGGKKFTVPCHQVMLLMRSFKSKKLIKEQFAWRHFYWFLNDDGVNHLRKYLHLAETVVPNTQKKLKEGAEREFERRPAREGESEGRGRGRGRGFGRGRGDGAAGGEEGRGRGRGFGRGRGRGFGGDRAEYNAENAEGRGRGRGFGFGRGRGRGAEAAAPATA